MTNIYRGSVSVSSDDSDGDRVTNNDGQDDEVSDNGSIMEVDQGLLEETVQPVEDSLDLMVGRMKHVLAQVLEAAEGNLLRRYWQGFEYEMVCFGVVQQSVLILFR